MDQYLVTSCMALSSVRMYLVVQYHGGEGGGGVPRIELGGCS